jgi:hypothetical protein
MRVILFPVILLFIMTGCIPKYVDQKVEPIKAKPIQAKVVEVFPKNQEVVISKPVIVQEEGKSTSYKVSMKTKKFSFSDTGFLVKYSDKIRLNVLAMGKPVLDLKIMHSDDICVGSLCNSKHGFNQSFLVGEYPDTLIENVLNKRPIFNGKNLIKTKSGFLQKLTTDSYDIKYQVAVYILKIEKIES